MKGYFARKPETMEDLERARGWGDAQEIQVVAEVTLSKKEYDKFQENLMEDYEFISQHTRKTGVKDGQFLCILIRKAGTKHTAIAVQSDGYDYARYAARVRLKANRYMDKEKGGGSL